MSLKKQMILYFSCLMIIIFTLMETINAYQSYRLLENNITSSITESLNLGLNNLDYYFQDAENLCSSIMADESVQGILNEEIGKDLDGRILMRELNRVITQYASTRPHITRVYLLDQNYQVIDPELNGEDVERFTDITENGELLNISALHQVGYIAGNAKVFSLVKVIYPYTDRERRVGTIVADIDYRILGEIFGDYSLPMNGTAILFDQDGNIVLEKSASGINWEHDKEEYNAIWESGSNEEITINGREYITLNHVSDVPGWKISALIPRSEFLWAIFVQLRTGIFLLLACLAVIVLVSRKIIFTVYRPLNLLAGSMKEIEDGNFNTEIHYEKQDEFSSLINGYNLMVTKIRSLLRELVEKEKIRRNAELYALQAQINPHFLYNTLNSIRYFARVYQAQEIREMTTALIQLSKASLSSEKFITVEQEVELTRQYLAIQKVRYGDILRFSCCLEPGLEDCLIPRFSIQPVVENALFHGILPKGEGTVEVEISSEGEGILIEVRDDGIGMSEKEIHAITASFRKEEGGGDRPEDISGLKNIGLENINYRIKINYKGDNSGVSLKRTEKGMLVILRIPQCIRPGELPADMVADCKGGTEDERSFDRR